MRSAIVAIDALVAARLFLFCFNIVCVYFALRLSLFHALLLCCSTCYQFHRADKYEQTIAESEKYESQNIETLIDHLMRLATTQYTLQNKSKSN